MRTKALKRLVVSALLAMCLVRGADLFALEFVTNCTPSAQTTTAGSASNLSDNNVSTWWFTNSSLPQWILLSCPSASRVTRYKFNVMDTPYNPTSWTFSGSNDGESYTTLDSKSGYTFVAGPGEYETFDIQNTSEYSYYRLNATAYNGSTFGCSEYQVYRDTSSIQPPIPPEVYSSTGVYITGISTTVIAALTPGIFKDFTGGDLSFFYGVIMSFAVLLGFKAGFAT